ncbi:MAG: SpoIIE family protein phosphatase [Tildeniella torsiva UHER 1998/13D]|nr:SpoIIE family protein phosphatase [Tildeniella torsiva UHER 1998/13D]
MTEAWQEQMATIERQNALMRQALDLGASIATENDFNAVLEKIVTGARALTQADAGVLFLKKATDQGDILVYAYLQADSLQLNLNLIQNPHQLTQLAPVILRDNLDNPSALAARSALTLAPVQIADLSQASTEWECDRDFDQALGYESRACLVLPLRGHDQSLMGVIKLINPTPTDNLNPFDLAVDEVMGGFLTLAGSKLQYKLAYQAQASWIKQERELQIGRQIQLDFLPENLPQVKGWEIAAKFCPAREVAGDFYDSFIIGQGRVGIVIADVCDKGVGAALFMSLFRSLLRILSQQNYSLSLLDEITGPAKSETAKSRLSRLPSIGTQALKNAIERTNIYIAENHYRTNMFATIFFGILDPATGKLIYINGGHEAPFICNAQGIKQRLKPTGPAVGVFPKANFNIELTQLEPGDLFLGFTDGVPDARNPEGKLYSEAALQQLIESAPITSAVELIDRIDTAVHAHIAGIDPFDDITLISVYYQT